MIAQNNMKMKQPTKQEKFIVWLMRTLNHIDAQLYKLSINHSINHWTKKLDLKFGSFLNNIVWELGKKTKK